MELAALLRLAQWHSNMDVAAANLRMFAHCGALVVLAPDFDEGAGTEVRAQLVGHDSIRLALLASN